MTLSAIAIQSVLIFRTTIAKTPKRKALMAR